MANLYVHCPNIIASMYTQEKLRDTFGFQILRPGSIAHFSDRFVIVSPPEYVMCGYAADSFYDQKNPQHWKGFREHLNKGCKNCRNSSKDKPVICSSPSTFNQDGNETWEKNHEWIDMFDALALVSLIENTNNN